MVNTMELGSSFALNVFVFFYLFFFLFQLKINVNVKLCSVLFFQILCAHDFS